MSTTPRTGVALCAVRAEPLSVDEVLSAVRAPQCGGVTLFVGVVRDHDGDHSVRSLDYSAHPAAADQLRAVCTDIARVHQRCRVAAVHAVGDLAVGDLAVVVAVAAPHRDEAFSACRALIDTLKARVPIWKHQVYGDGSTSWVGLP